MEKSAAPNEVPRSLDKSANGHDRSDATSQFDSRFDQSRDELTAAAEALGGPLRKVNQAEARIRQMTPLLPYAVAAVTVIGIAGALLRGRKVKPLVLIGAGLDIWRLWKGFQSASSSREFLASQATAARTGARSLNSSFNLSQDSSPGASKT